MLCTSCICTVQSLHNLVKFEVGARSNSRKTKAAMKGIVTQKKGTNEFKEFEATGHETLPVCQCASLLLFGQALNRIARRDDLDVALQRQGVGVEKHEIGLLTNLDAAFSWQIEHIRNVLQQKMCSLCHAHQCKTSSKQTQTLVTAAMAVSSGKPASTAIPASQRKPLHTTHDENTEAV